MSDPKIKKENWDKIAEEMGAFEEQDIPEEDLIGDNNEE